METQRSDTGREGEAEMTWESSIDVYPLSHVK